MREGGGGFLTRGHVDYEGADPLALDGHSHHPFAGGAEKKEAVIAGNARDRWLATTCSDEIPRSLKFLGEAGFRARGTSPSGRYQKRSGVPSRQRHPCSVTGVGSFSRTTIGTLVGVIRPCSSG